MNTKTRRFAVSIAALAAAGALVAGCSSDGNSDKSDNTAATTTHDTAGDRIVDEGNDIGEAVDKHDDSGDATLEGPDGEIKVQREIADKYAEIGGPIGHFGAPSGEQESGPDGGAFVNFERGVIFWSPSTGAHFVSGAILAAFNDNGGLDALGYPTDDPKDADGGKQVDFQKGHITDKDGAAEVVTN